MTSSVQTTPFVPAKAMAASAARPSGQADDAGTDFDDLLPNPSGKEPAGAGDPGPAAKPKTAHHPADGHADAALAGVARPLPPPAPTSTAMPTASTSIYQLVQNTPPVPDSPGGADEETVPAMGAAAAKAASISPQSPRPPRTGDSLIRPYGPPTGGGSGLTAAGPAPVDAPVKAPIIDPHGPPADLANADPITLASPVKVPLIDPHAPPADAGGSGATDPAASAPLIKVPLIEPHGPPIQAGIDATSDTPLSPTKHPPIDSSTPPDNTGDAVPADPAITTLPMKVPAIRPHSPPVGAGDAIDPGTVVAQGRQPLIDPHGAPTQVEDANPTGAFNADPPAQIRATPAPGLDANAASSLVPAIYPSGTPLAAEDNTGPAIVDAPIKAPLIDPHGPVSVSDDVGSTTGSDTSPPQVKPPLILPHGPPAGASPITSTRRLFSANLSSPAIAATGTPSPVDPHGPPADLTGTLPIGGLAPADAGATLLPAVLVNGLGQGESAAAISPPASTDAQALPGWTAAVSSFAGGPSQNGSPVSQTNQPANPPPVFVADASVPITTTAQMPRAATARPTPDDSPAAKTAPLAVAGAANLAAAPAPTAVQAVRISTDNSSQVAYSEKIAETVNSSGTTAANGQTIVTAQPITIDATVERDTLLKRGAAVTASSGLTGRAAGNARDGKALAATLLPTLVATAGSGTTDAQAVAAAPNAAPAAGVVQAEKMETLLQTVLDAGTKASAAGQHQTELHVRLNGADDVTVRLEMNASEPMRVTFHTSSPELRQALERGWSDFTANTAQSPAQTPDVPRFTPVTAGSTPGTGDFSSGQQSSTRQDARSSTTEDFASAAPATAWRGGRIVTTADAAQSASAAPATRRWSGWA